MIFENCSFIFFLIFSLVKNYKKSIDNTPKSCENVRVECRRVFVKNKRAALRALFSRNDLAVIYFKKDTPFKGNKHMKKLKNLFSVSLGKIAVLALLSAVVFAAAVPARAQSADVRYAGVFFNTDTKSINQIYCRFHSVKWLV